MALEGGGWSSGPLTVAATFGERFRGVRAGPVTGLLLWARSVHGFGLDAELTVLRLDAGGTVRRVELLHPGTVRCFRGRGWVAELPGRPAVPTVGTVLAARPILTGCPAG